MRERVSVPKRLAACRPTPGLQGTCVLQTAKHTAHCVCVLRQDVPDESCDGPSVCAQAKIPDRPICRNHVAVARARARARA